MERTVAAYVPLILHNAHVRSACIARLTTVSGKLGRHGTHLQHLPFEDQALLCGRDASLLPNLREPLAVHEQGRVGVCTRSGCSGYRCTGSLFLQRVDAMLCRYDPQTIEAHLLLQVSNRHGADDFWYAEFCTPRRWLHDNLHGGVTHRASEHVGGHTVDTPGMQTASKVIGASGEVCLEPVPVKHAVF